MSERPKPQQEAIVIREWLEKEIVAHGICPPLVWLFRDYQDKQGKPDWSQLEQLIEIESLVALHPYKQELIHQAATIYVQFILAAIVQNAPISKLLILPDFKRNPGYDKVIVKIKDAAIKLLLQPALKEMIEDVFVLLVQQGSLTVEQAAAVMRQGRVAMVWYVVESVFNPINFYGRPVTNRDTADLLTLRGPRERAKVLMRAPFYLFQVLNPFYPKSEREEKLDKSKVHSRNTLYAQKILRDKKTFDQRIDRYANQKS